MDIPRQFLQWFYEKELWKTVRYHGVRTLKYPMDMWNYQEIIFERNIDWVVETGTRHGGSALFFADQLRARGASGSVVTIDPQPDLKFDIGADLMIDLVIGDSGSAEVAQRVYSSMPPNRGPLLLILDSDHTKNHVLRELNGHVPWLRKGDYLIVEDTVINGHPVRPDFGPGPREAIAEFLATHSGILTPDWERNSRFGLSMADGGYFVRT